MTGTVQAPPAPGPVMSSPLRPSPVKNRTPPWVWVVIVLVILVVVAGVGLLGITALTGVGGTPGPGVSNDPDNARPTGSRALAQILDDRGADLRQVRGLDEFTDAPRPGRGTTVVVSSTSSLNPGTTQQFRERVRDADRVILIAPDNTLLTALDLPVTSGYGAGPAAVAAGCRTSDIDETDIVDFTPFGYSPTSPSATACFTSGGASNLVIVPRTAGRPEFVVLSGEMLTNEQLGQQDNAGVAIRVFASSDEILWYVPFFTDQVASDEDESDIPAAVGPLIVLGVFAVLALMLWRGRRFGSLVAEPLPAVVRAVETTRARGRMYHRAGADARAAGALRIHTLGSLASYLGLPFDAAKATDALSRPDWETVVAPTETADPSVSAIVIAVAGATHRDLAEVRALLAGPLPTTDTQLVHFTAELTVLEKEVRHTP
ncbi:DUF4350 domain-containing protein [Gordonia terrae]|uniref:DUF4350 domain-containing protein n=1 Tax=Gordonia terrae NBRC 100016 TaxID=1089454 RepID=A0ABQ0HE98_9ACTN|nr:hypothetical protein GOTRE_060_00970 [Gordonia terrae NBRC 100016]VTR08578.1 Uncharacterised protein [Clostridioides difficile]VTS64139.1 Uncharacterised protein [Gordonia terrae]